MTPGQVVRIYFYNRGIALQDVAAQLGISKQALSNLLSARGTISKKKAARFHELYGFSEAYLLTGQGELFGDETETEAGEASAPFLDAPAVLGRVDKLTTAFESMALVMNKQADIIRLLVERGDAVSLGPDLATAIRDYQTLK